MFGSVSCGLESMCDIGVRGVASSHVIMNINNTKTIAEKWYAVFRCTVLNKEGLRSLEFRPAALLIPISSDCMHLVN
jgi:hypothetical protein